MISKFRKLLEQTLIHDSATAGPDKQQSINMAAAVLFVEVMQADHNVDKREREIVKLALMESFSLSKQDANELLSQAEARVKGVTSLHEFTSMLHARLTNEEKVSLIEQIWRIILADEEVDKYEEHLVRRIAELLYVSHSDYIRAKLSAQGDLG
jgi:uncharacterized tellurite resistance protein B-like protein